MKPIVLVGSGENHYRLIRSITQEVATQRPIILVSQEYQTFPRSHLPSAIGDLMSLKQGQLDLWSACQRTGVCFINDECININSEDRVVHLKRYGKLSYHKLSVETRCQAIPPYTGIKVPVSVMPNGLPVDLFSQLQLFFKEVHRHCPKELRIVITGLSSQSLDLAYYLNEQISSSCGGVDIVLIEKSKKENSAGKKDINKKYKTLLRERNIRIVTCLGIEKVNDHRMTLLDGQSFSFDICIPYDGWQSTDFVGKLLQSQAQQIVVGNDLALLKDPSIFVTGENVLFKEQSIGPSQIESSEINRVLSTHLFSDEILEAPCVKHVLKWQNRPYLKTSILNTLSLSKDKKSEWGSQWLLQLKETQQLPLLKVSENKAKADLQFEASHMSRPWQGRASLKAASQQGEMKLVSSNGFNTWGSYAQSAQKICELAILKTLTQGVKPDQLRFHLSLPRDQAFLTDHIFESTFKAIEEIAQTYNIEINGGDTFDANHWHLSVTIGGNVISQVTNQFDSHDYLILTRPLGFGFLWSGRLMDQFDSQWIRNTVNSPILQPFNQWQDFVGEFKPSASVLIEEWGLIYHSLQSLPADQQLILNFREVPRWPGADQALSSEIRHPGLDANWQRIHEDVAFDRSEVSINNSVLWDSLSQGALVIGVKAEVYQQALSRIKEMGYKGAAMVGCIRPKHSRNKVVLSDWVPH